MPVTVIGDTTYGKPVGQYGLAFCDKVLAPVAFSIKNANLEGDFFNGIAPTARRRRYHASLGDPAEASFAEALTFMRLAPAARARRRDARARNAPPVNLPAGRLGGDDQRAVGVDHATDKARA